MKTLYEGILKGMDDTLKSGGADIAAASKDAIIDGITSNDGEKQKDGASARKLEIMHSRYARHFFNLFFKSHSS